MTAPATAIIFFGSFLAIGIVAEMAVRRWINQDGANLTDLHAQAGTKRREPN
jgi:hypothetical protein